MGERADAYQEVRVLIFPHGDWVTWIICRRVHRRGEWHSTVLEKGHFEIGETIRDLEGVWAALGVMIGMHHGYLLWDNPPEAYGVP